MQEYWPIGVLVLSNVLYHITTKAIPEKMDPFATMVVTYLIASAVSLVLFFLLSEEKNLLASYEHANWTTIVLGLSIVGLELGAIYMYKVGWDLSIGNLVQSSFVTVFLVVVGMFIYHESMTFTRAMGMVFCLIGLFFLNQ